jgi:hypothetical protein
MARFVLFSEEDEDKLMSGIWLWGTAPLKLKRWSPFFDPQREKKFQHRIWIKFLDYPHKFWMPEILHRLGAYFWDFISLEKASWDPDDYSIAWVLVDVDLHDDLSREKTIFHGSCSHIQTMDYNGIPFKCNRCHVIDHMLKDYPKLFT